MKNNLKRPWYSLDNGIYDQDQNNVLSKMTTKKAGLIVRSVNTHDELVAACTLFVSEYRRINGCNMNKAFKLADKVLNDLKGVNHD